MATNIDNGDQNITFDYKNPATGVSFNKLLYQTIPTGIYGDLPSLTKVDNTSVEIDPFFAILSDSTNKLSVKVNVTSTATATVSSSTPLIVIRYVWSESSENYAEIVGIDEDDLDEDDVVIGLCSFTGSVLSSDFDTTVQYDSNRKNLSRGNGAEEWQSGYTYTEETIVMRAGYQYFGFNTDTNLNKDPLTSPDYWIKTPSKEEILYMFSSGQAYNGTLSDMDDRNHANYQQTALIGKYELGGTFYNFYKVHLDGTTVTGDTELEALFDVDGTDEYFRLDMYAPEVTGTRTLIDKGDYVDTSQSSGGDADTVGELVEDQMQQITGSLDFLTGPTFNLLRTSSGAISNGDGELTDTVTLSGSTNTELRERASFDSADSPDARTGSTTHGKRFTVGTAYIIVMQEVTTA